MINVPITICETMGIRRNAEPITIGVPFAEGQIVQTDSLLLNYHSTLIPCQIEITASWFDGSIKWALLNFQLDLEQNSKKTLYLQNNTHAEYESAQVAALPAIVVDESAQEIRIDTGHTQFVLNKSELKPFEAVFQDTKQIIDNTQCQVILEDNSGQSLKPRIKKITIPPVENYLRTNYLRTMVLIEGEFTRSDGEFFSGFTSKLTFYSGKSLTKWDFTLHNPRAAKHNGGVWDLGDKGSIYFKKLISTIEINSVEALEWKENVDCQWQNQGSRNILIYQDSSGGENWNSQNHLNKDAKVPLKFRGFRCYDKDEVIQKGDRANPFIHVSSSKLKVTACIKQFWQNFPKAMSFESNKLVENNKLTLSLFTEQFGDQFELQGGEKKTHTLFLDFNENKDNLDYCQAPLIAKIPASYYLETGVFPLLPEQKENSDLSQLIQAGLDDENNFFAKREIIDEYSWRNFGDIFADHESLYTKDSRPNISHYNNQYDPINGFAQQFILTGDDKWFELMSDLAQHVVDIDIYHTKDDRHEYNGGLFWHTNHYVDAATSSHRTFSKTHLEDEPDIGGGPACEHCYTTGLATHYFLSGSQSSRDAVLLLAQWMTKLHEGNGGFFERLLKLKQDDLALIKQLFKGKSVLKYDYPFHRGTANYINTLLDAYSITSELTYLRQVEKIIRSLCHPNDDISSRNLEDLETVATWSYTIILQTIIKYLSVKMSIKEIDQDFFYARDCLIHYTDWMLENDGPYLDRPEVLEFPNHTWVAQDLRKAYILSFAAKFNPEKKQLYTEKANFFLTYVIDNLKQHNTRTYTRILVILMQNQVTVSQQSTEQKWDKAIASNRNQYKNEKSPNYSLLGLLSKIASELFSSLFKLSIKKEYLWIKLRLGH